MWDLQSIDRELHEIHSYLRDYPVSSENRRALEARVQLLEARRLRMAVTDRRGN